MESPAYDNEAFPAHKTPPPAYDDAMNKFGPQQTWGAWPSNEVAPMPLHQPLSTCSSQNEIKLRRCNRVLIVVVAILSSACISLIIALATHDTDCANIPALSTTTNPNQNYNNRNGIVFSSSGDNEQWVYADGVLLGHMADWTQTLTVTLPAATRVLAVKILDVGVVGGLLGSSGDGTLLTDSSWKCTRSTPTTDWTTPAYDDRAWPLAATSYMQGVHPWGIRPGISAQAQWIWNLPYTTQGSSVTVYCRKLLY